MKRKLAAAWVLSLSLLGCARGSATLSPTVDARVDHASAADGSTPSPPDATVNTGRPGDEPPRIADAGDDAGATPMCEAVTACATALGMRPVAGDTGADVSMASGTRSTWLSVLVSDTAFAGSQLSAKLSLTSTGGANYDLFVLQPRSDGGHTAAPKDCEAAPNASQSPDGTDIVSLAWNDGTNGPGQTAGDGLVLSVEVRHVSGPCGTWTLLVAGHQ